MFLRIGFNGGLGRSYPVGKLWQKNGLVFGQAHCTTYARSLTETKKEERGELTAQEDALSFLGS